MKLFVQGCHGFLGSEICRYALRLGHDVYGADLNTRDTLGLTQYFYRAEPTDCLAASDADAVIFAAGSASVPKSFIDPRADFEANVGQVLHWLYALRAAAEETPKRKTVRFLTLSSAAVYGDPECLPVHESQRLHPISPYGFHKLQAELQCRMMSKCFGIPTASLRIFSAFGAGLKRQVFWDLAQRLSTTAEVLTIEGDGSATRDFVHVHDVARAALVVLEKGKLGGESYNLANGEETSILEVAEALAKVLCPGVNVRCSGLLPQGTPGRWCANIGQIKELGYTPSVPFWHAVQEYVDWFKAQT